MSVDEDGKYKFKTGDRCNIEQYRMLKRCSDKKDITEWNDWRLAHRGGEWLSGADFSEACREEEIWLTGANLTRAHLEGADLMEAHLEGAIFYDVRMKGACFHLADLKGGYFYKANLEYADLSDAHLEGAFLRNAHLEGAEFLRTHLKGTELGSAHLKGADLRHAHLEGAEFWGSHLEGADFTAAVVDGETLIWKCSIDRQTDFTGVGLDNARVEPGLKQLLEYNIRRIAWKKGYGDHRWLKCPVRAFWKVSDYGRSTKRIIGVFFGLAIGFAFIYWRFPDCVMVRGQAGGLEGCLHALYFSVVTMTTLGFGDIYANPDSSFGQVLLMLQVLLGYILLGALVTRFAVLFTAGGPARRTFRAIRHGTGTFGRGWARSLPE